MTIMMIAAERQKTAFKSVKMMFEKVCAAKEIESQTKMENKMTCERQKSIDNLIKICYDKNEYKYFIQKMYKIET